MLLHIMAFLLTAAAAEPAWKIEITTTGGFTGQGAGSLTVAGDGFLTVRPGCRLRLSADDLNAVAGLVDKARPEQWKPSYVPPSNPHGCCDMIGVTFTLTRGESKWTSKWFDDHLPLPPDLDKIISTVWSSESGTIRSRYKAQCPP